MSSAHECLDRPGDQLDRDRGDEQSRDACQQFHTTGPQDPHDDVAVPHEEPEHDAHGDQRSGKGDRVRRAVDPLDEEHGRDDRPRSRQQRRPERNERYVRHPPLSLGWRLRRSGQQLQRDKEQEQPARSLQRGQLDAEVGQDQLAEQREDNDHAEGDERSLPSQPVAFLCRAPACQSQEDRYGSRRVYDDKQCDEDLPEELHSEERSWPQGIPR